MEATPLQHRPQHQLIHVPPAPGATARASGNGRQAHRRGQPTRSHLGHRFHGRPSGRLRPDSLAWSEPAGPGILMGVRESIGANLYAQPPIPNSPHDPVPRPAPIDSTRVFPTADGVHGTNPPPPWHSPNSPLGPLLPKTHCIFQHIMRFS